MSGGLLPGGTIALRGQTATLSGAFPQIVVLRDDLTFCAG
jgi:hypothetical protein